MKKLKFYALKKLILYVVLFSTTFSASAQCISCNYINFDRADSLWRQVVYIDTIHYHHNIWQVGKPQKAIYNAAYSVPNAIITDTVHNYPPNDTSAIILTFPGHGGQFNGPLDHLEFKYKLNSDTNSIAKMELSLDSGATWLNLADTTAGLGLSSTHLAQCATWNNFTLWNNLPNGGIYLFNDSIKLRFTFISGTDTIGKEGWMMDYFSLEYYAEGIKTIQQPNPTISLYPNPTSQTLNISCSQKITQVSIYNLVGQQIYVQNNDSENITINVADLPTGLYFVVVNGREREKFLKE